MAKRNFHMTWHENCQAPLPHEPESESTYHGTPHGAKVAARKIALYGRTIVYVEWASESPFLVLASGELQEWSRGEPV